jgi:hypothetical protein
LETLAYFMLDEKVVRHFALGSCRLPVRFTSLRVCGEARNNQNAAYYQKAFGVLPGRGLLLQGSLRSAWCMST